MGPQETLHGLDVNECISSLQKFIRRGMEVEAMEMAVEIGHTSKPFGSWVANRLVIMSYEDVGLAAPEVITLVKTCCVQAIEWYAKGSVPEWRMAIGTAIRALCRAPKSREGDHFHTAIGLRSELEGYVPEIPDVGLDKHTRRGRSMGRGVKHFQTEGTKLVPPPESPDPYEAEAYRLWYLQESQGKNNHAKAASTKTAERALFD